MPKPEHRTRAFISVVAFLLILNSPWILYPKDVAISRLLSSEWPALQASVKLGAVIGFISMVTALAVAVPAVVVAGIAVVVVLAFSGKSKGDLLIEGRKIWKEFTCFVGEVLLKEGNIVAVVCAVFGYLAVFQR